MRSTSRPDTAVGAIGILGGTFDPVHSAHLALAENARDRLRLERVLWVPAGQPWHRRPPLAGPVHRLAMVKLAIAGREGFAVDDGEIDAAAPGYTVETLERLRERHGATRPLVLLLGADAFLGLASWHRWHELFDLAHIAVATRPGSDLAFEAMPAELADQFRLRQRGQPTGVGSADAPRSPTREGGPGGVGLNAAGQIFVFELSAGTVSGTEIRALLAAGKDPGERLPPAVLGYIRTHHLYAR